MPKFFFFTIYYYQQKKKKNVENKQIYVGWLLKFFLLLQEGEKEFWPPKLNSQ